MLRKINTAYIPVAVVRLITILYPSYVDNIQRRLPYNIIIIIIE